MSSLDEYRGRLLARAFHDELNKLAAVPTTTTVVSSGSSAGAAKPLAKAPTTQNVATLGSNTAKKLSNPQNPAMPKTV